MNKISKKISHAENQQERLIMIGWVVGFVDGEGCFLLILSGNLTEKKKSHSTRL